MVKSVAADHREAMDDHPARIDAADGSVEADNRHHQHDRETTRRDDEASLLRGVAEQRLHELGNHDGGAEQNNVRARPSSMQTTIAKLLLLEEREIEDGPMIPADLARSPTRPLATSEVTHRMMKVVMTREPNQSSSWPLSSTNSRDPNPERKETKAHA